jgi:hypothetical protein
VTVPPYDPRPYIAAQEWVTARTVPEAPHEYVHARRANDPEAHRRMIAFVNATGERRPFTFGGRTFTYAYVTVDEHVYWATWSRGGSMVNRRRADLPAWRSPEDEASGALPWVPPSRRETPAHEQLRLDLTD